MFFVSSVVVLALKHKDNVSTNNVLSPVKISRQHIMLL